MKWLHIVSVLCAVVFSFSTQFAHAALISRLGGVAYYDDVLNITWLANANLAASTTFGVGGINADGSMTWDKANLWIAAMDADGGIGYLGYNDWRMPTVSPIDGVAFDYGFSFDGTTDYGYNISAPGTTYAGATGSEMSYMFYNDLGLAGFYDTSGGTTACSGSPPPPYCLTNTGPFSNLQSNVYWTGTVYAPDTAYEWYFDFSIGVQNNVIKSSSTSFYVWAVRQGDTVPLPATVSLFGSGLVGLIGISRRKKAN